MTALSLAMIFFCLFSFTTVAHVTHDLQNYCMLCHTCKCHQYLALTVVLDANTPGPHAYCASMHLAGMPATLVTVINIIVQPKHEVWPPSEGTLDVRSSRSISFFFLYFSFLSFTLGRCRTAAVQLHQLDTLPHCNKLLFQAADLRPDGVLYRAVTSSDASIELQQQLPEDLRRKYLYELFPDLTVEANYEEEADHHELVVSRDELNQQVYTGSCNADITRWSLLYAQAFALPQRCEHDCQAWVQSMHLGAHTVSATPFVADCADHRMQVSYLVCRCIQRHTRYWPTKAYDLAGNVLGVIAGG